MARSLRSGELRPIYVPSPEAVADRQLLRTRGRLVSKQTRVKNQIKAMVRHFGITFPEEFARRHWSAPFIAWLQELAGQGMQYRSASLALGLLLDELLSLRLQILEVTRAIGTLSRSDHYRDHVDHLLTIEGIGIVSAMVLMTELVDIDRFRTFDSLASFVGLVPGKHASGDSDPSQSLTNRRCAQLRYILIESAWVAARRDSRLTQDFERLVKRMKKTNAIIRIARKQLSRIRYVLKNNLPYAVQPLAA